MILMVIRAYKFSIDDGPWHGGAVTEKDCVIKHIVF